MQTTTSNNLHLIKVIGYSWYSPIIGTISISSWIVGIAYLFLFRGLPLFIFIINIFCQIIFLIFLIKQIRVQFQIGSKFLLGFKIGSLVLPLNWGIKTPKKGSGIYLIINSTEINNILVVHETRKIPSLFANKVSTRIIQSFYLEIQFNKPIDNEIFVKHYPIVTSEGFTGSPVCIHSKNVLQYYMDGNVLKEKEIIESLKKLLPLSNPIKSRKTEFEIRSHEK